MTLLIPLARRSLPVRQLVKGRADPSERGHSSRRRGRLADTEGEGRDDQGPFLLLLLTHETDAFLNFIKGKDVRQTLVTAIKYYKEVSRPSEDPEREASRLASTAKVGLAFLAHFCFSSRTHHELTFDVYSLFEYSLRSFSLSWTPSKNVRPLVVRLSRRRLTFDASSSLQPSTQVLRPSPRHGRSSSTRPS